jgi:hypothetical protein
MKKLGLKGTLGVVAAVLVVLVGGGAALAAADGRSPSPSAFLDSVAKHLGISSEKLVDATKAAAVDQVDAALEDGLITKEQAEAMKERIEAGDGAFLFGLGPGGPGHFGGFGFRGGDGPHLFGGRLDAAAEYLDLTVAELREQLAEGESLADVAKAKGKSVDGLKQALLVDTKEKLDEAVAEGDLTRERADAMLEKLESRIDDVVDGTAMRPGFGMRRFHGGPPFLPPAEEPAAFGIDA